MKRMCIIGAAGDPIAERLPAALRDSEWAVLAMEASRLADHAITLSGSGCTVEGMELGAVVFRCAANAEFSASFAETERAFADAEMRAAWLAATTLPAVTSFNRLDAVAWFETEHWSVWRRALARHRVPLARCTFGYATSSGRRTWVPFSAPVPLPDPGDTVAGAAGSARFPAQQLTRTLVACGSVLGGPGGAVIDAAVRALAHCGVTLARITSDEAGHVAWVDTALRDVTDEEAELVVEAIARRVRQAAAVSA